MDIPRTATEAGRVMLALDATWDPHAGWDPDTANVWAEMTRDPWATSALARVRDIASRRIRSAALAMARQGVDPTAPPVVVTLPADALGAHGWARMAADAEGSTRVGTPVRPSGRVRWAFVEGPHAPADPEGSRALVLAALGSRHAAHELDTWAARFPADEAKRARAEAARYRTYADDAEARISGSLAPWLPDVWADAQRAASAAAFPTVPAVLRATAHPGIT